MGRAAWFTHSLGARRGGDRRACAVADPDAPLALYLVLGIGMLLYQFALGVANDVVDVEHDLCDQAVEARCPGAISRRWATLLAAASPGRGCSSPPGWTFSRG